MVRSILKYSEKAENYATIKTKIKPNSPLLFIMRAKTHRFWVGPIVRPNLGLTRLTKTDSEPIGITTPHDAGTWVGPTVRPKLKITHLTKPIEPMHPDSPDQHRPAIPNSELPPFLRVPMLGPSGSKSLKIQWVSGGVLAVWLAGRLAAVFSGAVGPEGQ